MWFLISQLFVKIFVFCFKTLEIFFKLEEISSIFVFVNIWQTFKFQTFNGFILKIFNIFYFASFCYKFKELKDKLQCLPKTIWSYKFFNLYFLLIFFQLCLFFFFFYVRYWCQDHVKNNILISIHNLNKMLFGVCSHACHVLLAANKTK